jgi:Fibronectin type III domain
MRALFLVLFALFLAAPASAQQLNIGGAQLLYPDGDPRAPSQIDGPLANIKRDANTMYFWTCCANGNNTTMFSGPLNDPFQTRVWEKNQDQMYTNRSSFPGKPSNMNPGNFWLTSIYRVNATTLLGFIHHEYAAVNGTFGPPFAIGLAYSTDTGNTWTYLGDIARNWAYCDASQTFPETGCNSGGSFYLVVGPYFYVYYDERFGQDLTSADVRGIVVMRALVSDVLTAAANGQNVTWMKYSGGGAWNIDALTGGVAPGIIPSTQWSSANRIGVLWTSHSAVLNKYLMAVYTFGPTTVIYLSDDGVNWPAGAAILADDSTGASPPQTPVYNTFASLDPAADDRSEVGANFSMLYSRKNNANYQSDDYYRRLLTVSGGGTSPPAAPSNLTVAIAAGDTTPPTAPSGLNTSGVGSSQITLGWAQSVDTPPSAITYFLEQCTPAPCSNYAQIAGPLSQTTYTDGGLQTLTSYSYRVRAKDAAGNSSDYSNTASATTTSGGVAGQETVCTRGDIIFCTGFEVTTGCGTGLEGACWNNNGLAVAGGNLWQIVSGGDAAVGSRYGKSNFIPGATSIGFAVKEGIDPKPISANMRWYSRFKNGYISFGSGHGPFMVVVTDGINAGNDGFCGSSLKFQVSTYAQNLHYDGLNGCGAGLQNLSLGRNVGSVIQLNDRWYALETQLILDTACTNTTTQPWSGCNGVIRAWVDGVLTHEYTGMNLGRMQAAGSHGDPTDPNQGKFWQNLGLRKIFAPESFFHFEWPAWRSEQNIDNIVLSGNGTYIGCANTNGSTGCPGTAENPRGTGDAKSPYGNMGPYNAYLGRHAGGDCSNGGGAYLGQYATGNKFRSGGSLDPTRTHGLFVDHCVQGDQGAITVGELTDKVVSTSSPEGRINAILQVRDGQSSSDCTIGGGAVTHRCVFNGTTWVATNNTDNSMKVTLTNASDGGGVYMEDGIGLIFPQYVKYGWMWLPSGQSCTGASWSGNCTGLALGGFVSHVNSRNDWLAPTVHNGKWAIAQKTSGNIQYLDSAVNATLDGWIEYELTAWNTGRVSLMINRSMVLDNVVPPMSTAWMFAPIQPNLVHGVIDFQGTPPFNAWFDDDAAGTVSFWHCDASWGTSCPH